MGSGSYEAAGGGKERQERPEIANIGSKSRTSAAKTAYRGPKSGPGPPAEAQERPKITNHAPKNGPGPHAEAPRVLRPSTQARQLHDRPWVENVKDQVQRQYMLPVNFTTDQRSKI